MIGLLIGGTVVVCIGLLTVVFGIPIKEFSFGNTMILAGAVVTCTGLILIGLYAVGREFRTLGRRLDTGLPVPAGLSRETVGLDDPAMAPQRTSFEPPAAPRPPPRLNRDERSRDGRFTHEDKISSERPLREEKPLREGTLFARDQPHDVTDERDDRSGESDDGDRALLEPAAWDEHPVTRNRTLSKPAETVEQPTESAPRERRNIMFSSHRRDRNRDLFRQAPPLPTDDDSAAEDAQAAAPAETNAPDPFESAWPQSGRPRQTPPPSFQSSNSEPPSETEDNDAPEPAPRDRFPRRADASSVTIVKSGVVDSMAYSLYSDGSIEAQMPEGMVRFASIDELRAHLDQR